MFLAAMGAPRPAANPAVLTTGPAEPLARPAPAPAPTPTAQDAPSEDPSFVESLADLKGLKPLARPAVLAAAPAPPAVPPVVPPLPPAAPAPASATAEALAPAPVPTSLEVPAPPVEPVPPAGEEAAVAGAAPRRIQLAAGMAVEVDAVLDLRHHSVEDALGRLRDRLEDGALMGWRTLHVILGEDPALTEALLGYLSSGAVRIGRYAQAPIPMGGAQAWVLYY
ncbi:MAG TPA: Smr/MutS family protein [Holophagaceae bacterium]|nr:Smr/MutS family protein [Holophagaceae bacterium]